MREMAKKKELAEEREILESPAQDPYAFFGPENFSTDFG